MKNEINKPIHQKEKSDSKVVNYLNDLDVGKLGVGVLGLAICGGYFMPTILGGTSLAVVSSALTKIGVGAMGTIIGAFSVSTIKDILISDYTDEGEDFLNFDKENSIINESEEE